MDVRSVRKHCVLFPLFLFFGITTNSHAEDLATRLDGLFGAQGITLTPTIPGHIAHFSSVSLATLGLLTQQLASTAADFPAISTTPGFTFRYNSQIQAFERSSSSLGPVFVERAQTLGRGKLDIGVSFLSVDFDQLNGHNLKGLNFKLQHDDCCDPRHSPPEPGNPTFENDFIQLTFEKFSLHSRVVSFFATYGITDRWDVNLLIPVVYTSFNLRAHAHINNVGSIRQPFPGFPNGIHFFDASGRIDDFKSINDDKLGVGDIQLRTKYHLLEAGGFNLATGLTLRLPSGQDGNFQGLGDPTVTPFVALAQEYGPLEVHANGGIQINFSDSDRSRLRYAGGVTLRLIEEVALLVDVIGSSNLQSDRISRLVADSITLGQFPNQTITTQNRIVTRKIHADVVDLNVGFKTSPFGIQRSIVGFATVFVPLNDAGLRADVIPAVGLEVGF